MRRLPMRKIGDALRLKAAGLTTRKIAASLGIGQTTASEYLKRAERAGLSWPLPDGVSEADLGECPELCVSGPVHAVSDTQASKRSPNIMANWLR